MFKEERRDDKSVRLREEIWYDKSVRLREESWDDKHVRLREERLSVGVGPWVREYKISKKQDKQDKKSVRMREGWLMMGDVVVWVVCTVVVNVWPVLVKISLVVKVTWIIFKMRAYSASTPNTWMMQETTWGGWHVTRMKKQRTLGYPLIDLFRLPKSLQQWAPLPLERCQWPSWRCSPAPGTKSPAKPFDLQLAN